MPSTPFQELLRGDKRFATVAELLKIEPVHIEPGHAIFRMRTDMEQHANPMGMLHGGIYCDLADMAMGVAFGCTLNETETFGTLELKINYLRPVWNAVLTAEARVVQRGKTIGLVECDVKDERNRLVAKSSSTCMIIRGDRAESR